MALHDHNEDTAASAVIRRIEAGENVALVDAGPADQRSGLRQVQRRTGRYRGRACARSERRRRCTVSGRSATDRFCFEGFAPTRQKARKAWLESLG